MYTKITDKEMKAASPFGQKEILKHLKQFRNDLKESNLKARVELYRDNDFYAVKHRDSQEIIIKNESGRSDINSIFFVTNYIMAVRLGFYGFGSEALLNYAKNVAKELNYQAIIIFQQYGKNQLCESLNLSSLPLDTTKDSTTIFKFFGDFRQFDISNPFYYNITEGYVEDVINTFQYVPSYFKELETKEPTTMFSDDLSKDNEIKLRYYYKGYNGNLVIEVLPDRKRLVSEELEFEAEYQSLSELGTVLDNLVERSELQAKLVNIIDPPTHHLKRLLTKIFQYASVDFSKAVHEALTDFHSPEEIENMSLQHLDDIESDNYAIYNMDIVYFSLFQYYAAANKRTADVRIFNNKSDAVNEFGRLCKQSVKKKYEAEIADIEKMTNTM